MKLTLPLARRLPSGIPALAGNAGKAFTAAAGAVFFPDIAASAGAQPKISQCLLADGSDGTAPYAGPAVDAVFVTAESEFKEKVFELRLCHKFLTIFSKTFKVVVLYCYIKHYIYSYLSMPKSGPGP